MLVDVIREESREAIKSLKHLGVRVAMITGDSDDVAKWVTDALGIDEYFAKVLPQEKSEKVKLLQSQGYKVAMVGDGVNDAPALMQADLGIAIGAGTNVAIESAGIILVKNDTRDIPKIIRLSQLTYAKMIQESFGRRIQSCRASARRRSSCFQRHYSNTLSCGNIYVALHDHRGSQCSNAEEAEAIKSKIKNTNPFMNNKQKFPFRNHTILAVFVVGTVWLYSRNVTNSSVKMSNFENPAISLIQGTIKKEKEIPLDEGK